MLPHERSLVERMKDRPFAFVGVNSDQPRPDLKDGLAQIPWRNFCDGSTSGPISTRWSVQGWPTLYLIDDKGIVRIAESHSIQPIEEMAEKLVAELEKSGTRKG